MKAKVNLRDSYSGRNINIICEVENVALIGEPDKWCYMPQYLSDYQRKKIENFFGTEQAYHTTAEVVKIYPTAKYIYITMGNNNEFDNFKNMTKKEIISYVMNHYNCSRLNAQKIATTYITFKVIENRMHK